MNNEHEYITEYSLTNLHEYVTSVIALGLVAHLTTRALMPRAIISARLKETRVWKWTPHEYMNFTSRQFWRCEWRAPLCKSGKRNRVQPVLRRIYTIVLTTRPKFDQNIRGNVHVSVLTPTTVHTFVLCSIWTLAFLCVQKTAPDDNARTVRWIASALLYMRDRIAPYHSYECENAALNASWRHFLYAGQWFSISFEEFIAYKWIFLVLYPFT